MMKKLAVIMILLGWVALPASLHAQEEITCRLDVIVQIDDWLSKLSDKFYGDVLAFPAIAEATNAKSAVDPSYAVIEDVDLIEPGWKLCIVEVATAENILGFTLEDAPLPDETPTNLGGTITIGAAHALSGPLAEQGAAIRGGVELAVEQINQNGLLGESSLQVIWEDTAGDKDRAVAAFDKLINQDQVVAILGPTSSRSAFVANGLAQAAGVPVIGSSNTAEGITDIGDFIFSTSLPQRTIVFSTIRRANLLLNLQKMAILYAPDDAFARYSAGLFEQALASEGIELVATIALAGDEAGIADQLSQLVAQEPEAVVLSVLPQDAANLMRLARQVGLAEDVRFIGGSNFNTSQLAALGDAAVNGAIVGSAWSVNNGSGSNRTFVAAYEAAYGSPPDQLAAQSYAATWAVAAALRRANTTDRSAIRDALDNLEFIESPLGIFNFDENRNADYAPVIQVVENGSTGLLQ